MKTDDLFLTFLSSHGFTDLFFRYFFKADSKPSFFDYLGSVDPRKFVSSAFLWVLTDEGTSYWTAVSDLWQKFLEQQHEQTKFATANSRRRKKL